jgi:multisubunit Na+/H+ antiporter MnhB subunit
MTPLVRLVTMLTLPIALLISMAHLLGAEEGPGDGFTAGIISALGFTLRYLEYGYREAHRNLGWVRFEYLFALGVGVALVASVMPMLVGNNLLAPMEITLDMPIVGELSLKRALLFEIGIYLVVLGGAMTAIDWLRSDYG